LDGIGVNESADLVGSLDNLWQRVECPYFVICNHQGDQGGVGSKAVCEITHGYVTFLCDWKPGDLKSVMFVKVFQ
jgi:hypothetical protein